jgi:hypothetical protein
MSLPKTVSIAKNSAQLSFDVMMNGFHLPIEDGKINRILIEDSIVEGIITGELTYYVDEEIAELAIALIEDQVEAYNRDL